MGIFRKKITAAPPARYTGMRPPPPRVSIESRDYKIYRKMEKEKLLLYERIARRSEKFISLSFDKRTEQSLQAAIDFTGLRISSKAPFSLFVISIFVFFIAGGSLFAIGIIPNAFGVILVLALGLLVGYYLLRYPIGLMKAMRIKASSEVVLAILYMVVSMRISPNLERALRFTSSNITGALAWDMRRLMWDIEMGKYSSGSEALTDYIAKWKPENEEFSEALRLIRESQRQVPETSGKTLDEALRVVLEGTKDRMKHYAQDLQMPVTIIHMMGIVLPILGSVMAPMAAVFLSDSISPLHFFLGYDILLPIILLWFINNTLNKRPVTFSEIDITRYPNLPPKGTYMLKSGRTRLAIPVLPLSLLIALLVLLPAVYYFSDHPELLVVPSEVKDGITTYKNVIDPDPTMTITMSMVITLGITVALIVFFILTNIQRSRIEEAVYKMESEFELALFQLKIVVAGTGQDLLSDAFEEEHAGGVLEQHPCRATIR